MITHLLNVSLALSPFETHSRYMLTFLLQVADSGSVPKKVVIKIMALAFKKVAVEETES